MTGKRFCISSLTLASLIAFASPAVAAPFFAQSTASVEIDGGSQPWTGFMSNGSLPYGASAPSSSAVTNPGGTHNGASGSASASSDLSTGQLKAYATVVQDDYTNFSNAANSTAVASFGDSFTTATQSGSPFVWGAGDVGRFNLDMSGTLTNSFGNPGDINFGIPASNHLIWSVGLQIYQTGTFASGFTSGGYVGVCNWYGYLDGSTSNSCSIPLFSSSLSGSLSTGVALAADLITGGDFDWWLSMGAYSFMLAPGSLTVDLSQTLNVGYTGPAGSVTTSASGVFPFTQNGGDPSPNPVPVPGMTWLIGLFLLGLLGARGRRSCYAPSLQALENRRTAAAN